MTTLGGDVLTLADLSKRMDPDGMPAQIAEVLSQSMPILEDIPWKASNLPTAHRSTIRAGLPTVNLRRLNQGSASSKSTATQVTDGMALIDAWSTTDAKLLELGGNAAATRFSEGKAFIEAMGQKVTELLFYGSEADDDREFNGLTTRYVNSGNIADNVLDAGGTGGGSVYTSIWLIGWGDDKIHGIYPQHCMGGLQHQDHGLQIIQESTDLGGSKLAAYTDQWKWDCGLVVKDWRYAVRISNILASDLLGATGTQETTDATNIINQMIKARHRIPNLRACKPVYYMARSIFEGLDTLSMKMANGNVFKNTEVDGMDVTTFRGIPIKIVDQLVYTEAEV